MPWAVVGELVVAPALEDVIGLVAALVVGLVVLAGLPPDPLLPPPPQPTAARPQAARNKADEPREVV